jgi:hypothetical protein
MSFLINPYSFVVPPSGLPTTNLYAHYTQDGLSRHGLATLSGNVQLDDSVAPVFGDTACLFDGTGDYFSLDDSSDWTFGTGDWTVDFRIRFSSDTGATQAIITSQTFDSGFFRIVYDWGSNQWQWTGGSESGLFSDTIVINTWYHVELSCSGGSLRCFRDGVQRGSTESITNSINPNGGYYIGSLRTINFFLNGRLDEFRISKGVARHTSGFTPETSAYEWDEYTVYLNHFEGTDGSRQRYGKR